MRRDPSLISRVRNQRQKPFLTQVDDLTEQHSHNAITSKRGCQEGEVLGQVRAGRGHWHLFHLKNLGGFRCQAKPGRNSAPSSGDPLELELHLVNQIQRVAVLRLCLYQRLCIYEFVLYTEIVSPISGRLRA